MKRRVLTIVILLICSVGFAQTQLQNYSKTTVYTDAYTDATKGTATSAEKQESINYVDGLGRPKQQIAVGQSPLGNDIVSHIEYDGFGRQVKEFLPYATTSSSLEFKTGDQPVAINGYYQTHYGTDLNSTTPNPFSEKVFENSPLGRVLEQAAPGEDWAVGNGHTIEFEYQTNAINEVYEIEASLDASYRPISIVSSSQPGYYASSRLIKIITKSENWTVGKNHTTEEFKNTEGRVILKRTYTDVDLNGDGDTSDTNESEVAHDTYYVYDIYGNLSYVLPPKVDLSDGISTDEFNELSYQYVYDHRNRLIEKKIPGKDVEYIVYDNLDRPVMTQDANLRLQNKWLFTKYDAYGRMIYTGLYTTTDLVTTIRDTFKNKTATQDYENKVSNTIDGKQVSYGNSNYPTTDIELLTLNYYDRYSTNLVPSAISLPTSVWTPSDLVYWVNTLPTITDVKVLDNDNTTNDWITTVTGYDKKSRPIWIGTHNSYLGTTDIVKSELDFTGRVVKTVSTHSKTGHDDIVTIDEFTYDHASRLVSQTQRAATSEDELPASIPLDHTSTAAESKSHLATFEITMSPGFTATPGFDAEIGNGKELIALNTYDELGQLKSKKVGGKVANTAVSDSQGLQTVDYAYNIRGWLEKINTDANTNDNDLFDFLLIYNKPSSVATPLFNGNISRSSWRTANTDSDIKTYTYSYDALNRITKAVDNTANYNLDLVSYDKNGNILHLQRKGHINTDVTAFGVMDDLTYTYDAGNKLTKVVDVGTTDTGFKDGTNTTDDYAYDANGNMTKDENKGITNISYNHLNLPTEVTINNGTDIGTISYLYDAAGMKLEKKVIESNTTKTTSYAGNYIYEDDVLQFFSHPEGYVSPELDSGSVTGYNYVYQYKDHLGNVRLSYADSDGNGSITASTEIIEENNYYPFGLKHKGYNNQISASGNDVASKFKTFQSQEVTEELGLNVHEWKYRISDPSIGRFWQLDPLAEDYYHNGTYNFSENRVIDAWELEGLEAFPMNSPSTANTHISEIRNGPFKKEFEVAAIVITVVLTGGAVLAEFGVGATTSFIGNEIKDEILSQATGGASDIFDLTKGVTKLFKEGANKLAKSSAEGLKLNKQLASEQQMSEVGKVIAGGDSSTPLRKASELAKENGGKSSDYVKKSSSSHTAADGTKTETHWEENTNTGERYNQKTKIETVTK